MVLKRKFSIIMTMLICLMLLFGLTACGDTSDSNNDYNQQTPQIVLSEAEQEVYNSIVKSLYAFKNPASVTVLAVSGEMLIGGRYVKISAQNGFGGYSTSVYQANYSGLKESDYTDWSSDYEINVANINKKLAEYKQSQGLA